MEIKKLSYVDFVSLIKEENRPPGGKKTIHEFLTNTFMNQNSKILEVGCTNGFTSLEVARTLNCNVWGIDIHKDSVKNAKKRVKSEKVKFSVGNAEKNPFKSNMFDMVISSNATSFVKNKEKAVKEYARVIKPWGFLATCPMYYIKKVPNEIIKKTSNVLGFEIEKKSKAQWIDMFKQTGFEIYYTKDLKFEKQNKQKIKDFIEYTCQKPHIKKMDEETIKKIRLRLKETFETFNENLSYMGYSIVILRKRTEKEEMELFTTKSLN